MNKLQFVEYVDARLRQHPEAGPFIKAIGSSPEAAALAVEVVVDALMRATLTGHRVAITGFASLDTTDVPSRMARNPQNGDRVRVPARRKVVIKPHAAFNAMANGEETIPVDRPLGTKAPKGSKSAGKGVAK